MPRSKETSSWIRFNTRFHNNLITLCGVSCRIAEILPGIIWMCRKIDSIIHAELAGRSIITTMTIHCIPHFHFEGWHNDIWTIFHCLHPSFLMKKKNEKKCENKSKIRFCEPREYLNTCMTYSSLNAQGNACLICKLDLSASNTVKSKWAYKCNSLATSDAFCHETSQINRTLFSVSSEFGVCLIE